VPHRALARVWWFHLPGVTIVPRGTSKCKWVSADSLANNEQNKQYNKAHKILERIYMNCIPLL
jgi:hypothetical protein